MIRYAIAFLLFSFPVMATPNLKHGGTPIPAAASSVGYTTNTFHVGPFTTSNVDTAETYNAGFLLYPWNLTGGSTPSSDVIINADGSLTLNNGAGVTSVGSIITTPFYHGEAFGCGAYFTAEISFDPILSVNLSTNGFPAFWAEPWENSVGFVNSPPSAQWPGQVTGYVHFTEFDIMEWNRFNPAPKYAYGGTIIDWYGKYNVTCGAFCSVISNFNQGTLLPPPYTNYTLYHRYAGLWVPATNSTSGYVQYYFDDIPLRASPVTWTQYNGNVDTPPPTSSSPWLFGVIDVNHMILISGRGGGLGTGVNMNVRSIDVWQGSGACNITN